MSDKNLTPAKPEDLIHQTLEKNKSLTVKALDVITDVIAPTPKGRPKEEVVAKLTDTQRKQLVEIEENAIAGFTGQLDELESALGMLLMGHHFGWKVLYLIHSKKTVRKYEDILGVKIRDIFDESGPSSDRSVGLALAMKASNFWKVVSGEQKIENLRKIE
jgi:hypothetical protein